MLIIATPLSDTGCKIRRQMNYCEKMSECNERRKLGYCNACSIKRFGVGNPTILSLIKLLNERIINNVEDEAVANNLIDVVVEIECMVSKVVGICGLGLDDEGVVRK